MYEGELEQRLQQLLRHDSLCITVNSDDPAFFGGYMLDNWRYLLEVANLSAKQIVRLHENSFQATFLTSEHKSRYLQQIQAAYERFTNHGR